MSEDDKALTDCENDALVEYRFPFESSVIFIVAAVELSVNVNEPFFIPSPNFDWGINTIEPVS